MTKKQKEEHVDTPQEWKTGKILRKRAHSTGLVDFDYWVYAFENAPPTEPEKPFRRGRIWA